MFGKTALHRAYETNDTGSVMVIFALSADCNTVDHFQYVRDAFAHRCQRSQGVSSHGIVIMQILETFDTRSPFMHPIRKSAS